jgi:hypothetical protein
MQMFSTITTKIDLVDFSRLQSFTDAVAVAVDGIKKPPIKVVYFSWMRYC